MIAALTDTLSEHPELTSENQQELLDVAASRENLMKQLLKLNTPTEHKTLLRDMLLPNFAENLKIRNAPLGEQMKNKDLSLNIDKYTNHHQ